MAKKEFEVFLSSDQNEFSKIRKELSKVVCSIQFLTCTLLENRGAETTNIVEASVKAVRDSDIYVGIFGKEYSETVIKEYKEAVRCRKPCLTYVKKVEKREEKLSKFIYEELINDFKYSSFRGSPELGKQVETDLRRLLLDTLNIGFEERAKKKEETFALIKKEEKAELQNTKNEQQLEKAKIAFQEQNKSTIDQRNYIESIVRTTIALEAALKKAVLPLGYSVDAKPRPLGELLKIAASAQVVSFDEETMLREMLQIRNMAVHQGDTPNEETTRRVLDNAQSIIDRLNAHSALSQMAREPAVVPNFSKDIESFIARRKPEKNTETVFRMLIGGIQKISDKITRRISDKTVLYKMNLPFVSVELRKERVILHLTLPSTPREKEVEYIRRVYDNLMHGHLVVKNLNQIENAVDICKKAYCTVL